MAKGGKKNARLRVPDIFKPNYEVLYCVKPM